VSYLGAWVVAAVVALGLLRGVLLDGVVSLLSAEWRPTLGMKGLDRVYSTGFGEGPLLLEWYLSSLAVLQVPVRRPGPG
jgi:hypothetical protein